MSNNIAIKLTGTGHLQSVDPVECYHMTLPAGIPVLNMEKCTLRKAEIIHN